MGNGVYYRRTEQNRGFELLIEISKKIKNYSSNNDRYSRSELQLNYSSKKNEASYFSPPSPFFCDEISQVRKKGLVTFVF